MGKRVMGIGAHPDDLEWYAGATIAKLANEGAEIIYVICTDGDKGSYDPDTDPRQLAAQRRREQEEAASSLGIAQVIFLGYRDGELEPNAELCRDLATLYRKHQPELLLTFDPWKRYELHPDHLTTGNAALAARLAAKMPLFYPDLREQGLAAWAIPELWLFNADTPNHFVDVSDTLDAQLRALAHHRSQTTVWEDAARSFLQNTARDYGKSIGVKYAQVFRRLVIEGALVLAQGVNP